MRAADWIGGTGETWADEWRRTDRSFAGLDPALEHAIVAAAPITAVRLVDIGSGAGQTSLAIAEALPSAEVVGLDLSADLVAAADRRRDERGLTTQRCRFVAGDAVDTVATLAPVDLFFSRHGVMFFDDPVAAFGRMAGAASPRAPLIFSCFAALADNAWATLSAAAAGAAPPPPIDGPPPPGPFAFADTRRVNAILADSGWRAIAEPERVEFGYVAGGGADPFADAVGFFSRIGPASLALKAAPATERPALLETLAALCADHRDGDEVVFPATAWLWSARAMETAR